MLLITAHATTEVAPANLNSDASLSTLQNEIFRFRKNTPLVCAFMDSVSQFVANLVRENY